jgi:hypothetical protein
MVSKILSGQGKYGLHTGRNPASVLAVEAGLQRSMETRPDGSQAGYVIGKNGVRMSEWDWFRKVKAGRPAAPVTPSGHGMGRLMGDKYTWPFYAGTGAKKTKQKTTSLF